MKEASFSADELCLLYTLLKERTVENNSQLDDPATPPSERDMIISENRSAFSALRKLKPVLSEVDPAYVDAVDRLYQTSE